MVIKVRVNIDPDLMVKRAERADHILALQAKKDTEPYVPKLNGKLRELTFVEDNRIIYNSPYAHYLYVGKLYVDPETKSSWTSYGGKKEITEKDLVFHTKGTSAKWFEVAKKAKLNKWLRVYRKALEE